ncbi:MAG: Fe-S protein, partial [Mycobacterium sp.]
MTDQFPDYQRFLDLSGSVSATLTAAQWKALAKRIVVVLGGLLGMGAARQKRTGDAVPRPLFAAVGVLAFAAAAVAVLW